MINGYEGRGDTQINIYITIHKTWSEKRESERIEKADRYVVVVYNCTTAYLAGHTPGIYHGVKRLRRYAT